MYFHPQIYNIKNLSSSDFEKYFIDFQRYKTAIFKKKVARFNR